MSQRFITAFIRHHNVVVILYDGYDDGIITLMMTIMRIIRIIRTVVMMGITMASYRYHDGITMLL